MCGAWAQQLKDHLAMVLKELQYILRALSVAGSAWYHGPSSSLLLHVTAVSQGSTLCTFVYPLVTLFSVTKLKKPYRSINELKNEKGKIKGIY